MPDITPKIDSIADDILDGVAAYVEFLGWPKRRIYYLLEKGHLPGGKFGDRWVGSKQVVRRHMKSITGAQEVA